MKRRQIGLALIVTTLALWSGAVSANSLSELRERHHRGVDTVKQKHNRWRTVTEKRTENRRGVTSKRIVKKKTVEKRVIHKRALERAKRAQKRIDRNLHRKYAKRRDFKSLKEFKRQHDMTRKRVSRRVMKHATSPYRKSFSREHRIHDKRYQSDRRSRRWQGERYGGMMDRDNWYGESWRSRHHQRGYRHTRRSWYMTYLYERAHFYDRHGYKYGYFSRRGFMFEGTFYRYDRYYTYRDRLRGRGLFERRYYRPRYSQFGDLFAQMSRGGSYFYASFDF